MKDKIVLKLEGKTQFFPYPDPDRKHGFFLENGINKIDEAVWDSVKESPWVKCLIRNGLLKIVDVKKQKELKDKIKATNNLGELECMMEKTDSKPVKIAIGKKIKKIVDGE